MNAKTELKQHVFTYPEDGIVYWEIEAKRVDLNLPHYFARKIQEVAEALDAEVYAGIWWPYLHITLIRDITKDVEECMGKQANEIASICKEECGGDQKCFEECVDKTRLDVYNACREDIGEDLWPRFAEKARELKHIAELYGIVMQTGVYTDHEGVKLGLRIEGYYDAVPIRLGRKIFWRLLDVTYTKHFTDAEEFALPIAEFLVRFYGIDGLVKLVESLSRDKMYVSRIYDEHGAPDRPMRKYEITINYNNDKIRFLVTEEKLDNRWVVTNITPLVVLSSVADLTPD
jgi:hypothetical protein